MNVRTLFMLVIVGIVPIAAVAQAADEYATVNILSVRGGDSYVELEASAAVCTSNSISASWGKLPRISYGTAPEGAKAVQSLATAALLAGRPLKIKAATSGSGSAARCILSAVWLEK
jgi:hypothetical protein